VDKAKLITLLNQVKVLTEECLAGLEGTAAAPGSTKTRKVPVPKLTPKTIDFDIPIRPFLKRYVKGMSGAKKFTLLLSHLVKGDMKKEAALVDIEKQWNRSTSLLKQEFNHFFVAQAKENDWINSTGKGLYVLRPSWKKIFD